MKKLLQKIVRKIRCRIKHVPKGSSVGHNVKLRNVSFEGNNHISENSKVINTEIGFGSGISKDSDIQYCQIGRYTCLAPNVKIVYGEHPTETLVSVHPAFYSARAQMGFTYVTKEKFNEFRYVDDKHLVIIGNDVWVGSHVIIMEGVTIGDGAIIAAGAVVTKDVSPYAIVGGVPAKVIRYRFDEETIKKLMNLRWWDKDQKWIESHAELFEDVNRFIDANTFSIEDF